MGMDMTAFDAALKDYYTAKRLEELVYNKRPLLALMKKVEKFGGRKLPLPVLFGNARNVATTLAGSQAKTNTSQIEAFELTRVKLYNTVTIDTEVMEASDDDEGAWLSARTAEIDSAINGVSDRLAQAVYRTGYGEIGQVGSFAGSTITITPVTAIHGVEKGDVHQFSPSLNGAVLDNAGASLTVLGVNRNTGVITYTAGVAATVAAIANNDYIFASTERQNSATPSRVQVCGVEGWCPVTAPSSGENFFGVDRSMDSRLCGTFYNGTADATEDAIIEAANRQAAIGGKATYAFTSYTQFSKIVKSQRQLERFRDTVTATVGFSGVTILGPQGPIKVIPDQFCPSNRAVLVDPETLGLYSIGKAVRVIDNDGLMALRQPTNDGIEVRVGFKGNVGCPDPRSLAVISLTAV